MTDSGNGTHSGNASLVVLDNGLYSVGLNDAGGGWSRFGARALSVWSDDPTVDGDGFHIYIRDLETGRYWSAGLQPTGRRPDRYTFYRGEAPRIHREDAGILSRMEVRLVDGEPAELRRLSVENRTGRPRILEVTTCVPLALDHAGAYAGHPAFSRLFLQTMRLEDLDGIAARRRPRSPDDPAVSAVHLLVPGEPGAGPASWETDRARFLGRGRSAATPRALDPGAVLGGSLGNVLDPILALRRTVRLEPGGATSLTAVLAAGLTLPDAEVVAGRCVAMVGPPVIEPGVGGVGGVGGDREQAEAAATGSVWGGATGENAPRPGEGPLRFFNGYGGFTTSGDEYVIRLGEGPDRLRLPPLPWVNVIANEHLGFLASETGAGCTWAGNSRLNRLTPWANDPVTDPHGEALYVRDEEDGVFWSPFPGPAPGEGPYEARHGYGYTRFRHTGRELDQEVCVFVATADPVKVTTMRLANRSGHRRRLSVFAYNQWVLGGTPADTRETVETEIRPEVGAVLAANPGNEAFPDAVAFAAVVSPADGATVRLLADRTAFLGPRGTTASPAALASRSSLPSGADRPPDPCAALQIQLDLDPGTTVEVAFLLGQGASRDAALELLRRYRRPGFAKRALEEAVANWRGLVDAVQVRTPSPALDLMVNGWLTYQNVSCRLHGRSAFYQSGGAYGFRDQLQDSMALVWLDPDRTRRQILEHAAHQFPEGDVLHWWHPPASDGIRTRFSDDLLWLPYVTAFYMDATGDASVLDEPVGFVRGRALEAREDEAYLRPDRAEEVAHVFEHCARAIDRSLTSGSHGLPLMGTGDWNDGMNRVGREGRGESVWLGFFLASILERWIPLARERGETERGQRWSLYRERLVGALEDAGWDGDWYRRAYYDDGAPIGSRESDECRIDAIAQAWAVLSGVAPRDRAERALDALEEHLVREDEGLIRLLTPPFDATPRDPGYIKGYLPGVRENGGQYTHGVLWAVLALAEAGRIDRAAPLLEMLTPVARTATAEQVERYKVEPYVVAADVYGAPPHVGRGGWTWYTGSAAWMWRVAVESILGVTLEGGTRLRIRPRIPGSWPGFSLELRVPGDATRYRIEVNRVGSGTAPTTATVDDSPLPASREGVVVPLCRDGLTHVVRVTLGAPGEAAIGAA